MSLSYHLRTIWLFTKADYKTIFFPVFFASLVAPVESLGRFFHMVSWVWLHLLQANVSNQTYSGHEDRLNKPWRPLPSGRISESQARELRWLLLIPCLVQSAFFGWNVVAISAALSLVEIFYDDVGFSKRTLLRSVCNVGGYMTFEAGATLIATNSRSLDGTAHLALMCSGLIIFTTIHAQDFADVPGDMLSGRRTLPIILPRGSRLYMCAILIGWSNFLPHLWELGPLSALLYRAVGFMLGCRYIWLRSVADDEKSYVLYNMWLLGAHVMPANVRWDSLLAW